MDPNEGFGRNKTGPQLKSKEEREAAGEETHDDDDGQWRYVWGGGGRAPRISDPRAGSNLCKFYKQAFILCSLLTRVSCRVYVLPLLQSNARRATCRATAARRLRHG